ncbi:exodeoxyribonuclease I [Allofranklinella schreckenbergeri]|uniref:Exodeoxyribonuclease I n=1 Tax=Allofranklinella schreckenbergeri TaxID=1076744 RepID=A0A3M6QWC0_9BURK|nr:exodeoxyribonuclease I [Allofranklinella schreckenbergeri]RMX01101.1 exodeoxyribonuclease I [Allofranklinella schreckenbergeri]RMX07310.1 exodeoxyribonuclease I [Allofranklinella schreckenbergeri]
MHTFLWHDYETFGADPRRDRPAQFAAVRTDAQLQEIESMEWFCQPPLDYLPDPQSCLITGITPQQAREKGLPEHAFAWQIYQAFSRPGTIGVGYNTIRFDDEFTRFLFWRNLLDPYGREWRNGNARWDLLDVARLVWALRPEGIEWPRDERGQVSFKLERLSAANALAHEAAHDALSDVRATLALARLIRARQPRLFEFALRLRDKREVAKELGFPALKGQERAFVHISGMFAPERGCLAVMWPLASHPHNRNEVLAWDLAHDPGELAALDAAAIRQRLFTRQADLPQGVQRLPLKSVHLNKSPMVVGDLRVLTPAVQERWDLDMQRMAQHAAIARDLPDMSAIWAEVYARPAPDEGDERIPAEQDLYGGFISDADRQRLDALRQRPVGSWPQQLGFEDARLDELVFFFRARNFPRRLSEQERARWQAHRRATLLQGQGGARSAGQLMDEIDALYEQASEAQQDILGALYEWAGEIAPET